MSSKTALKIILIISIVGLLFSGYLSFQELFVKGCLEEGCTVFNSQTILDLPVCIYGFIMYLLVFIFSILGLVKKTEK